jgi:predicted SnoaL-like aldol condensation-catalyzing enzyme
MTALSTPKQQVFELLKSIETGDPAPVAYINPAKYIQHNLSAADGLQGFGELMQMLPPHSAKANTLRVFEDGDYVFTHTDYDFFGPKAGFDIFRFENGQIVEHWDNLQEKPGQPNPSGHTMFDGANQLKDLHLTDKNKAFVRRFVEEVLIHGQFDKLPAYINRQRYIQHNPQIADGLDGLAQGIQALAAQGLSMQYTQIHKILGEGCFVLVVSEGLLGGQPTAFYDLFQVEEGLITEHWDTIEAIPPRPAWKNSNGKF